MKKISCAFCFILAAVAGRANAHPALCGYSAFRPGTIAGIVRSTLQDAGIAVLEGNQLAVFHLPIGRSVLARESAVLGEMQFDEDIQGGTSDLGLFDVNSKEIFSAHEQIAPCGLVGPVGRCQKTEVTTELDAVAGSPAPFSLVLRPTGNLSFFKYGKDVSPADWHAQFGQMLRWLQAVITHPTEVNTLQALDDQQRIQIILATDPLISPYIERLSISWESPYWEIRGVVPSDAVYGAVLEDLQKKGFLAVKPDMIIDERTELPAKLGVNLAACYE